MSEAELQNRINVLPKEHPPRSYEVLLFDKKDRYLGKRYVRASSQERAKLTGYRVDRYLFGNRNAYRATAAAMNPGAANF